MPESQQSKISPIIEAVKPTQPSVVVPPQTKTPDINQAPQVSTEPIISQKPEESKPIENNNVSYDDFGRPIPNIPKNYDDFGRPVIALDSEGAVIHKLRALKDFLESSGEPIDKLVEKIGGWNIPSFNIDTLVAKAALVADKNTMSIDEIKNLPPEQMGQFMKGWKISTIPEEMLAAGLENIVHETQEKIGWRVTGSHGATMNFAWNMAREMPHIAAQLTGSVLNPLVAGTLGYGRAISAIGKTTLGKETLIPALDATIDYAAGHVPKWLTQPIGKAFVWKYGLPGKEQFSEFMGERMRYIKQWFDVAEKTGATLYDGLSIAGQKMAQKMLKSGYDAEEIERMALYGDDVWKAWGVTDKFKFIKDVTSARQICDETSIALLEPGLKSGFLDKNTADVIKKNIGTYMHRFFEIFENPHISQAVKSGKLSVEEATGLIESNGRFLKRVAGYSDDKVLAFNSLKTSEQNKILTQLGKKYSSQSTIKKPITAQLTSLLRRGDLDKTQLLARGEIETAAYGTARHITDTRSAIANLHFFERLAENPDWVKGSRGIHPLDWIHIPRNKKFGALANKWVHPEIASEVTSIHNITKTGNWIIDGSANFLKRGNKIWKMNKVLFSPATHVRNMVFNAVLLDCSGIPLWKIPALLGESAHGMWTKNKLYQEAVEHDVFGSGFASSELMDFLPEIKRFHKLDAFSHFQRGLRGIYGKLGDVYRSEEEWFKFAKFIHQRKDGVAPLMAAVESKKWLFDYNRVSPIVEAARSNPLYNIPFITFTSKAIPRIVETAIKNPFKLYKYKLLMESVNKASQKQLGLSDDEFEYIKRKRGASGVLLGDADSNGDPRWLNLKQMIPWGIAEDVIGNESRSKGLLGKIPQALQPGGVTKIGYDVAYNQDTFTGQPIYGTTPDATARMLGYVWKSMAPTTNPFPMPGGVYSNVQTVGPVVQKLADGFYSSGMLYEPIAKALLAHKSGYYGATKGASFAILNAILGFNITPVQTWVLQKSDARDLKRNLEEAKRMYKSAAKDQGLMDTEVGKEILRRDEVMMEQRYQDILQEWEETQ